MKYKVKIDGKELIISKEDIENIKTHDQGSRIISYQDKLFEISNTDGKKEGRITINHNKFDYHILDKYDQVVEELGMDTVKEVKSTNIYAPMPGLILDIAVKVNEEVEEGQIVLILEAMKMENVIRASGKGTVRKILFDLNDKVEKGQLIIEIE